jgi:AraC-like DNA-binding protein/quercetin dioxygenase-like cupin family protein
MRVPHSRSEASKLSAHYARRDAGVPISEYFGYFYPTPAPVLLLVTDHHAPGTVSPVHSHPCVAFHGCLQGPITLLGGKGEAHLDAGTCYLFAPGVRHHWRNDGAEHAVMLSFLVDADRPGAWPAAAGIKPACQELKQVVRGAMRLEAREDASLQQSLWQLADCLAPEKASEPVLVTGLVWTLIGRLLDRLRAETTPAQPGPLDTAQQIRRVLVQSVQDRLSLADIAQRVHLSPSRAKEVFRAAFGCGIMSYFNRLKIQQAKHLLCDPTLTVKQVSQRLGFSTPAYFDQVFYRCTGLRPTEFRRG